MKKNFKKRVNINLGNRSYDILIAPGILADAGKHLEELNLGKKVLLVTNPVVFEMYGKEFQKGLENHGFSVETAVVPDGEEQKNLRRAGELYDRAFDAALGRDCPVAALGGGVIGDLAGFVASTYMRGVPFIQLPTTLLAQVDSSVGGKVAVNHPRGKNIIGSFYQPRVVFADLNTLESLPERELKAGLAEVIKYGVIKDAQFFEWLEDNMESLLDKDHGALAYAVEKSCRVKAAVVEEDETEKDTRAVLNFGHTVGHALEALTNYEVYRHGEAVAVGMAAVSRMAERMGIMPAKDSERVVSLVERAGLPSQIPSHLSKEEIVRCFYMDKKVSEEKLTFIIPLEIGRVKIERNVSEKDIYNYLF